MSKQKLVPVALIEDALKTIKVPKMSALRAEYFKAGARAAIHAINSAMKAAKES